MELSVSAGRKLRKQFGNKLFEKNGKKVLTNVLKRSSLRVTKKLILI